MPTPEILVAAYAAVVASINVLWTVYSEVFRDKAKLRISITQGMMPSQRPVPWETVKLDQQAIFVEFANAGPRPITVVSVVLEFKDKSSIMPGIEQFYGFPMELTEGKKHMIFFAVDQFKQSISERPGHDLPISAVVTDALGKIHKKAMPKLSFLRAIEKQMR